MPGDVAGHQVRGELDPREFAAETAGQRTHQQGLAQPGNAFEQDMAASDQRREHIVDHRILANQGSLQLMAHRLDQLAGALTLLLGVDLGVDFDRRRRFRWVFAHRAFLRVCRWATWRLKSALDSRCLGRGCKAWLMALVGWRVRRASTCHWSATASFSKPG